jgi:hypothetical protein
MDRVFGADTGIEAKSLAVQLFTAVARLLALRAAYAGARKRVLHAYALWT